MRDLHTKLTIRTRREGVKWSFEHESPTSGSGEQMIVIH